jgi:predicted dehydrogenase
MRPFNPLRFAYNWHWFWDTGNGDIGNQGIHEMDIARWGLGRSGAPKSVVSTGGKMVFDDDQETPNTQIASFNYGDAELMFEVRGLSTGDEGGLGSDRSGNVIGDLFYGSEGWMAVSAGSFQVYKTPKAPTAEGGRATGPLNARKAEKVMDEKHDALGDTGPHMENFLAAVRSRNHKDLNADVEIAVASANLVHLANASYRVKRELQYDEATRKFVNDKEADQYLTRKYRAPYVVPDKV